MAAAIAFKHRTMQLPRMNSSQLDQSCWRTRNTSEHTHTQLTHHPFAFGLVNTSFQVGGICGQLAAGMHCATAHNTCAKFPGFIRCVTYKLLKTQKGKNESKAAYKMCW